MAQQDQRISEAVDREYAGLRSFIRKGVADQGEAEDILQDVFYELVEAYRLMKPVEQSRHGCSAWPAIGSLIFSAGRSGRLQESSLQA
jgi:DNA-directed RNA polymerase specialized sigma24 family protein